MRRRPPPAPSSAALMGLGRARRHKGTRDPLGDLSLCLPLRGPGVILKPSHDLRASSPNAPAEGWAMGRSRASLLGPRALGGSPRPGVAACSHTLTFGIGLRPARSSVRPGAHGRPPGSQAPPRTGVLRLPGPAGRDQGRARSGLCWLERKASQTTENRTLRVPLDTVRANWTRSSLRF